MAHCATSGFSREEFHMTTKHIIGLTALAAASALSIAAVAAPTAAFDPRKCSAIENVDVPYDVGFDSGRRIAFRSGGRQIVVAPAWMEVDGHRFADPALSPAYYQHVRGFLQAAVPSQKRRRPSAKAWSCRG